jgi:TPR repeat protein
MHTFLLILVVVLVGCSKKNDDPPAPTPSPTTGSGSGSVAPTPPTPTPTTPTPAASDCVDYRDNKGLDACKALCDAGTLTACNTAGTLIDFEYDDPAAKAPAVPLYQKACDGGVGEACQNIANYYRNGFGGLPKDEAKMHEMFVKATPLFEKECAAKNPQSCFHLGGIYEKGWGTQKPDPKKGLEYYNKACDAGSPGGCSQAKRPPPEK